MRFCSLVNKLNAFFGRHRDNSCQRFNSEAALTKKITARLESFFDNNACTDDFRTVTRQRPFERPACDDFAYRDAASALLAANPASRPIRLVGFGVTGFTDTPPAAAPSLFGPDPAEERAGKREALSRALDDIRESIEELKYYRKMIFVPQFPVA